MCISQGHPNEALQDFTGFPTILYNFREKDTEQFVQSGELFKMMVAYS